MLRMIRRFLTIRPYSGTKYTCTVCGRMTIHSGPCAFCGGKVA